MKVASLESGFPHTPNDEIQIKILKPETRNIFLNSLDISKQLSKCHAWHLLSVRKSIICI